MSDASTLLDRSGDGDGSPGGSDGRGGQRGDGPGAGSPSRAVLGMWLALVPILVLFLTLVTAYVLRRGAGGFWAPLPSLVWFNTVVLLASSACLEGGRAALRRQHAQSRWFSTAFALGILFLLGQVVAWLVWWRSGMGPGASQHSAFFYILTGTHGVHVLGGMFLLGVITFRGDRIVVGMAPQLVARLAAIYWHFLAVLWLCLLLLLQLWK